MAIVFLQAVNATLKRVNEIAGDSEELATSTVTSTATGLVATDAFVDSRRQHKIDIVIQLWNEAIHEAFSMKLLGRVAATGTITLASGEREYDLPVDFERMAGDTYQQRALRGATTGLVFHEYPGGYAQMLVDQPTASDYTGTPMRWALSVSQAKIRMDTEPSSAETGSLYNFLYEKRLAMTSTMATSTFPFSDSVADALVPVVSEAYNAVMKKEFNSEMLTAGLNRSLAFLRQVGPSDRYGKRRTH